MLVDYGMDAVVVGAGVVGLAIARQLALDGHAVTVVETEPSPGRHTSSRNSEILHAGIYYPPGSLKARLCVKGRKMLYAYCRANGVPHNRTGKLLVATSEEQVRKLKHYWSLGSKNEVDDLRWLSGEEARAMEPALHCLAAIHSPSTGVIDASRLMAALQADAEAHGAKFLFGTKVLGADVIGRTKAVHVEDIRSGDRNVLRTKAVVNAAGLWAQHISERLAGLPRHLLPPLHLVRGCYFTLKGDSPFSHLIYPMPEEAGLGTHLTLDLQGTAKFGPDTDWITWEPDDGPDYSVDPRRADKFYAAIRHYWPGLQDGQLQPAYSGIRPKVAGPGEPTADFVIQGPAEHGIAGVVCLLGIESPGLTSSLALAELVASKLKAPPTVELSKL